MINLIFCVFNTIILVFFVFISENSYAQHVNPNSESMTSARPSAQKSQHVVSTRDIAKIIYTDKYSGDELMSAVSHNDITIAPQTALLTAPRNFVEHGFYIWRNPEGVWNININSNLYSTRRISGRVESENEIIIEPIDYNFGADMDFAVFKNVNNKSAIFQIEKFDETYSINLQFVANGSFVEFDLQINDVSDPGLVYIGAQEIQPEKIPFRIENRPITIPEINMKNTERIEMVPSKSTRDSDKGISVKHSQPSGVGGSSSAHGNRSDTRK